MRRCREGKRLKPGASGLVGERQRDGARDDRYFGWAGRGQNSGQRNRSRSPRWATTLQRASRVARSCQDCNQVGSGRGQMRYRMLRFGLARGFRRFNDGRPGRGRRSQPRRHWLPTLLRPDQTAPTSANANPTLSWSAVGGATMYRVPDSHDQTRSPARSTTRIRTPCRPRPRTCCLSRPLYWRVAGEDSSSNLGPWGQHVAVHQEASRPRP